MPQLSLHAPFGDLTLAEEEGALVSLDWGWVPEQAPTPLLRRAAAALHAYFDGAPLPDDLPLDPPGTAYQRRVWQALREIPHGQTRSYAEIAARAGGAPRAVGQANARNPIPILIPCHRVVSRGDLGGYSGAGGLATKRHLLRLEGVGLEGGAA
jgi:methylated-DNA-[protein]-cysteine S-methyltransferase